MNNLENENVFEITNLLFLDKKLTYDVLSIPSKSEYEYRLVTAIIIWAKKNGIKYECDDYGNLYLTKGELEEGEYYPCVTSHLDTVQCDQTAYVLAGLNLDIKTEVLNNGTHKLYVDGMGIGADDRNGIVICMNMFNYHDKLKAAFFLEEETGMCGSRRLNVDWFNDVGYVIGFDSPDLNRAAWCSSGEKLFDSKFYIEHLKEVTDLWGFNNFRSEPFTDVNQIRQKTNLICMNFGNGGYDAHSLKEYTILEDMDKAGAMGSDIIFKLGLNRYELSRDEVHNEKEDEDNEKLRELGFSGIYKKYKNKKNNQNNDNKLNIAAFKYLANRYEKYIEELKKEVINNTKKVCEDNNIDFNLLESVLEESFDKEINF